MANKKKKFPLPRARPMRSKSNPSSSGVAEEDLDSPAVDLNTSTSERSNTSNRSSKSPTTRRNFGRKPSFRFGRKGTKKGLDGDCNNVEDCNSSTSVRSDGDMVITGDNSGHGEPLPPPLPTAVVGNTGKPNITIVTTEQQSSAPPLMATRTRSLTPSDYHYHTSPSGGCNAPLTPISQHYASNDALLDLFSTLYEQDQYSVAYAVGIKFVEVALFTIPSHGYYRSSSSSSTNNKDGARSSSLSKKRTQSAADAVRVTKLLGGMVDEMEDDEDGGVEKIEILDKLANVAKQHLKEAALDDELKGNENNEEGNSREKRDNNVTSQISRIWNEYIGGKGGYPHMNNVCSLPDNICSFWNMGKDCNSVLDDAIMECDPVKKKAKFDNVKDKGVAKKVSNSSASASDSENLSALLEGGAKTSEIAAKPMEVESVNESSKGESLPSILTEQRETPVDDMLEDETKSARKTVVVEGRLLDQQKQQIIGHGDSFDKGVLQLALSRSMSMKDKNSTAIVSSSSEEIDRNLPNTSSKDQKIDTNSKVAVLTSLYEEQYHTLRNESNRFHVRFLDTYQGRNPASTNGCTVIAPLMCIQYFTSTEQNAITSQEDEKKIWRCGIPDELINQVIDEHAATVLPEVRNKLNLEGDAFIVPSDVHDHLIEVGLLCTSQFVGVCGGNILDDDHLASFKSALLLLDDKRERERLKGRKIGATFFFHGHVVALHVVNGNGGKEDNNGNDVWVELIDSLPNPETWVGRCQQLPPSRVSSDSMDVEEQKQKPSSSQQLPSRWSGSTDGEWEYPPVMDYEDEFPLNAVRVRCMDVDHFDILIRHYACSKFSEEEQLFIDTTVWDDSNSYCDSVFDPRIFQAFIWAEAA